MGTAFSLFFVAAVFAVVAAVFRKTKERSRPDPRPFPWFIDLASVVAIGTQVAILLQMIAGYPARYEAAFLPWLVLLSGVFLAMAGIWANLKLPPLPHGAGTQHGRSVCLSGICLGMAFSVVLFLACPPYVGYLVALVGLFCGIPWIRYFRHAPAWQDTLDPLSDEDEFAPYESEEKGELAAAR